MFVHICGAGTASDITLGSTFTSSRPCESTGVFLSRKGYVSCCTALLNLLHNTSINLCNCHCIAPDDIAACNLLGSHDTILFHLYVLVKKGAVLFMNASHLYLSSRHTLVRCVELVIVTALCSSGMCMCARVSMNSFSY